MDALGFLIFIFWVGVGAATIDAGRSLWRAFFWPYYAGYALGKWLEGVSEPEGKSDG